MSAPAVSFEIFSRNESIGLSTIKSDATFSSIPEEFKSGFKSGGISGFLKRNKNNHVYNKISTRNNNTTKLLVLYMLSDKLTLALSLVSFPS